MTVISLTRRIARLDRGISPEVRALASLTDAELDALIKSHLARVNPALAERYTSETTCTELHALFADAQAERDHPGPRMSHLQGRVGKLESVARHPR
jgi:hypothetical protein